MTNQQKVEFPHGVLHERVFLHSLFQAAYVCPEVTMGDWRYTIAIPGELCVMIHSVRTIVLQGMPIFCVDTHKSLEGSW